MLHLAVLVALIPALSQSASADDKSADAALEAFKLAYRAQVEAERADAVSKLASTVHPKTLNKLTSILTSPDGPGVRCAAAKGIGEFGALKKQAAAILMGAYPSNAKDPRVQMAILQSLGTLGDPTALPTVHRAFEEKDVSLAKAGLAAAAVLNSAGSIDPLIAFLAKTEKTLKANSGGPITKQMPVGGFSVNGAKPEDYMKGLQELIDSTNLSLQTITQQQLTNSADWQAWWNRSRATFKPK